MTGLGAARAFGTDDSFTTLGISTVRRSCHASRKDEALHNAKHTKERDKIACRHIANNIGFKAGEPLVGERSHRVDLSRKGLV
jgi:hypothetical protein